MLGYYMREGYLLLRKAPASRDPPRDDQLGMPVGPFGMQDIVGSTWARASASTCALSARPASKARNCPCPTGLFEMGRYGRTGAGWYRYERGSGTPIPSLSKNWPPKPPPSAGITRQVISDDEISR